MEPHKVLPKIHRLFYGNPALMKHNPGDIQVIEENCDLWLEVRNTRLYTLVDCTCKPDTHPGVTTSRENTKLFFVSLVYSDGGCIIIGNCEEKGRTQKRQGLLLSPVSVSIF